ncbi:MAG: dihydrolipoamide acetyltransferase family protein [Armatimonadota bacterium]|nr:dihydrolipoamide acetyltransferase family protein [Armatimonadota bacterium]MDR7453035.1 dihydrolipoamide acetyltransferase family protein [Armatimonadota bacterium]MDR7455912.1 dihydrolipoamide acetyltransferase family protein [Armatimonadota bacterium]
MAEVIMPKMGDAMTEGKVLRWMKQPGDPVARGEPIAEIETDKVNVDLEAEDEGTLAEIVVPAGEVAQVGATIAIIRREGEPAGTPAAKTPAGRPAQAPAATTVPRQAAVAAPAPAAPEAGPVRASPLARRLAEQHGIPLASITGTGPEGRITKEDVEAAVAAREATPRAADGMPAAPAAAGDRDEPLSRMRQTIARRMTEAKQQIPHIYITMAVGMDAALALRRQLNEGADDARKVSVNDLVVRATALALRRFPALNAAFVEGAVRYYGDVNISVAVALPEGLIAPTLYHCDRKSVWEIAAEARALAERARAGKLRAEDLQPGTFTISNLGMFDVDVFSAIVNPPQAAILAVGAAKPQPVVRDGALAVATMMQMTCSADHRVTDGAEVARFLAELRRLLEQPVWLVASRPEA